MYDLGYDVSNKILCYYQGDRGKSDRFFTDNVDPKKIPSECDVILYALFQIDQSSIIEVDESKLNNFYWIYFT